MKKILLILSVLLVSLAGCGTSFNKTVKTTEEFMQKVADDNDAELFSLGELDKDELKSSNKLYELKEIDFKAKKEYELYIFGEDYQAEVRIISFSGEFDTSEHSSVVWGTNQCILDGIVLDIDSLDDAEGLCDELNGEFVE